MITVQFNSRFLSLPPPLQLLSVRKDAREQVTGAIFYHLALELQHTALGVPISMSPAV